MDSDQAAFLETLRHTLSEDNKLRGAAEKRYEDAKRDQPAATIVALFQVLAEPQVEQPVREQSAVLLRQCLSKATEEDSLWRRLGEQAQADVRARLLHLLEAEAVPQVRRKVAHCIQGLGNSLISIESGQRPKNAEAWPELMPALLRTVVDGSKDSGVRADCLWVVKEMAITVWQILVASSDQVYQILHTCLSDPADAVRTNAASLLCNLVESIDSKEERKPFQPLVPEVVAVLTQLAGASDPKLLNEMLQSLQATAETADFFKASMEGQLLPLLSNIAKSHSDEEARKYAFEVIISFMEGRPKAMVKVPGFIQQALEVCVHFMVQLGDDVEAWAAENEEEGEDDEEHHTFGKEAVDRICRCTAKVECFPVVLEVLKPAITKLFQSSNWKEVVAAVSTLSQMAEYIDDEATVVQMVQVIKVQLTAAHARVRYAAWAAVAQFAEDHSEVITTDAWAAQLLPEFLNALDDSCQRTCLRSMEAFQHYGEAVEREDLEPFLQPLMEKLGAKLQAGDRFQKKAITFIAVVAGQVEEAFAPYYAPLMPVLKQVIQGTLHKVEERTLLGKCFECISLLAKAVGREGFRADAELIMQAMIQATQVPNLPNNDPVKEYMMAASERICATMREDFLPFVPHILPGVLEKFTLAPREFSTENADDLKEGGGEVNLMLMEENGKVKFMLMYSSELQDLKGALECVHTFVEKLGKAYSAYVAQTAQALLPVFDFSMAEEIRDLAFETWGQLCSCARADGKVQIVSELLMEFLKRILPKFEAADTDIAALKTRTDGITTCLKKAGPGILSAEQVRHLCQLTLKLIGESMERREEAEKERKAEQDEEGDMDEGDEEGEEQPLRVALCEVTGAIMQHHPDIFAAEGLASYLALVQRLVRPGGSTDDRKLAAFVVCDFLDHLGARVTSQWPQFLPQLLEDTMHQDAELRQPACYGLSLAAKEQAFAPLAADAARKLTEVVTQSRKREKKKSEKVAQACADNALSALVEILLNQQEALAAVGPEASAQLWGVWLSGLPCQEDEQEGVKNHKILLQLLQQEKPEIVGQGGQNVPKLLAIFVDLYKTDMVDEATSKDIGQLMLRVGSARLDQYAAQYSQKQCKKLKRIVEEAQKQGAA